MTSEERDPGIARAWRPPREYLDALAQQVLPVYQRLKKDLRWLAVRREFKRKADMGPTYVHIRWGEEIHPSLSAAYFLLRRGFYLPEDDHEDPREGPRLRLLSSGVQNAFWDSLVDVMEETQVLDADGVLRLPLLLDATVRTLELWATELERGEDHTFSWHPPTYPWPGPDDAWEKDDLSLPLPIRVESILDRNRSAWSRLQYQVPASDSDVLDEVLRRIGEVNSYQRWLVRVLVERVLEPRTARALMTIRECQIHEELQNLGELRKSVENMGNKLFNWPMPSDVRWRLENAMTSCLDALWEADQMKDEAERALADFTVPEGFGPLRYAPDGTEGRPKQLCWDLAHLVYELIYQHRAEEAEEGMPSLGGGKPWREILDETAKLLSWAFPPEDLRTGSTSNLYKRINERSHTGGTRSS